MGNENKLSRRSFVVNAAAFGTASLAAAGVFVNPALADEGGNQATASGNPDFGESAASKTSGTAGAHASTQLPEAWDAEYDVVVVGSGAGGSTAAAFTSEGGLSTVVYEQMSTLGGSAIANAGVFTFGGGTAVQKAAGYDDSPENYKAWLKYCGTDGVPDEFLDIFVYDGIEVVDWLLEIGVTFPEGVCEYCNGNSIRKETQKYDPEFAKNTGLRVQGNEYHPNFVDGWLTGPVPTGHCAAALGTEEEAAYGNFSTRQGHGGPAYMLPIIHKAQDNGAEFVTDSKVDVLYKDPETGAVVGAQVLQGDKAINVKANKAVVIAGGCWLQDTDLIEKYAGRWAYLNPLPLSVSDGSVALRLGIDAGGAVANGESMWMYANSGFGLTSLFAMECHPFANGICVDEHGMRRFCEDEYTPGTCDEMGLHQLNRPVGTGKTWYILDDVMMQAGLAFMEEAGQGITVNYDYVVTGENVEDLAEKIGAPMLPEMMALYNSYAEQGADPMFGKRCVTPFVTDGTMYASAFDPSLLMGYSHGGLDIDVHCQVLDSSGNPIPGLFAAGRSARSICEGRHEPTTGLSAAPAMVMGRVAGRYIADGTESSCLANREA